LGAHRPGAIAILSSWYVGRRVRGDGTELMSLPSRDEIRHSQLGSQFLVPTTTCGLKFHRRGDEVSARPAPNCVCPIKGPANACRQGKCGCITHGFDQPSMETAQAVVRGPGQTGTQVWDGPAQGRQRRALCRPHRLSMALLAERLRAVDAGMVAVPTVVEERDLSEGPGKAPPGCPHTAGAEGFIALDGRDGHSPGPKGFPRWCHLPSVRRPLREDQGG
jgi:hypothetical protein